MLQMDTALRENNKYILHYTKLNETIQIYVL